MCTSPSASPQALVQRFDLLTHLLCGSRNRTHTLTGALWLCLGASLLIRSERGYSVTSCHVQVKVSGRPPYHFVYLESLTVALAEPTSFAALGLDNLHPAANRICFPSFIACRILATRSSRERRYRFSIFFRPLAVPSILPEKMALFRRTVRHSHRSLA